MSNKLIKCSIIDKKKNKINQYLFRINDLMVSEENFSYCPSLKVVVWRYQKDMLCLTLYARYR